MARIALIVAALALAGAFTAAHVAAGPTSTFLYSSQYPL